MSHGELELLNQLRWSSYIGQRDAGLNSTFASGGIESYSDKHSLKVWQVPLHKQQSITVLFISPWRSKVPTIQLSSAPVKSKRFFWLWFVHFFGINFCAHFQYYLPLRNTKLHLFCGPLIRWPEQTNTQRWHTGSINDVHRSSEIRANASQSFDVRQVFTESILPAVQYCSSFYNLVHALLRDKAFYSYLYLYCHIFTHSATECNTWKTAIKTSISSLMIVKNTNCIWYAQVKVKSP